MEREGEREGVERKGGRERERGEREKEREREGGRGTLTVGVNVFILCITRMMYVRKQVYW